MDLWVGLALLALWGLAYVVSRLWRQRRPKGRDYSLDVLAIGALGAAVILFYWSVLVGIAWVPAGGGDFNSLYYPYYTFQHRVLQAGELPLWNPYAFGGMPGVAYTHSSIFYPFNLLVFLFAPEFNYYTLQVLGIFHYFLAAAFMYLLARELGQSRFGAAIAGLAYTFGGYLTAHFGHLSQVEVTIWLPLVFLFLHRALERSSPGWAIAGGLALGVSLLGGHTQVSLYMITILSIYWLYHVVWQGDFRKRPHWSSLARGMGLYVVLMGVAFGIAAFQLVSTAELVAETPRAEINYDIAAEYSMAPSALITLVVPQYYGQTATDHWGYWDPQEGNLTEFYSYGGILTLVLAALGLLLRRNRFSWFFLGLAIFCLLVSFGGFTVLQRIFYHFVPAYSMVRVPARFLSFFGFALAVLAGFGADLFLSRLSSRHRRVYARVTQLLFALLAAVVLVVMPIFYHTLLITERGSWQFSRADVATRSLAFTAVLLALTLLLLLAHRYWRWPRPVFLGLLVLLMVFDLFSNQAPYNLTNEDLTKGFNHPEVISYLRQDTDLYRIDSVTGVWDVWQPYTGLLHGYQDVTGVPNPLVLTVQQNYWEALGSRSSPFYDLLNVKYVLAHKDVVLDWNKFERVHTEHPTIDVFRNNSFAPRAIVVHSAFIEPDSDVALQAIRDQSFDPFSTVLLEQGTPLAGEPLSSTVTLLSYGLNDMSFRVDTEADGYLVLGEMYYPGWEATVDGRPQEVLRANYALRAVFVPAGSHTVTLSFAPKSWVIGWALSLVTWSAVFAYAIYIWWSRRTSLRLQMSRAVAVRAEN